MKRGLQGIFLSLMLGLVATGPVLARCADHVPQPKPQNTSRQDIGADLDSIRERGFITFAVYEEFPPWSSLENGKPVGVDIEIGRLIAQELGVDARFQLVGAAETLEADLRNWIWKGPLISGSVANVMLHVPYDSEFACRVEQVVFTGQYHVEEIAIAYARKAYPDDPPLPAYFRFDTVGVENDSIADFYLSSFPGGQLSHNVSRYPDTDQAMRGLEAGDVKAVMGARAQLEHGLTPELEIHTPPLPGFSVSNWTAGLAVHFAYRPLAYAVDDAIVAAIQDGRMEQIFDDHGLSYHAPELR